MRHFKIDKIDDFYMVKKPLKDDDGFEKYGKRYSSKGLFNLLRINRGIEFIISDEIKKDIKDYEDLCSERKSNHFEKDIERYEKSRIDERIYECLGL